MTKVIDSFRELTNLFEKACDKSTDLVITYNGKNYRVKHKKDIPFINRVVEQHFSSLILFEEVLKKFMKEEQKDDPHNEN